MTDERRDEPPARPARGRSIVETHVSDEGRIAPAGTDPEARAADDAARAAALDPATARREGARVDAGRPADPLPLETSPEGAAMAPGDGHAAAGHAAMSHRPEDSDAERIARMREARGEAGAPPTSRMEARARMLTTALPFGWKGMLAFGILTTLGGIAAILSPFLASLAVAAFAAATFVVLGAGTVWMAFRGDESVVPHRLMNGAIGALMIVFGVLLFLNPLEGLLSLTILVAAFFVAEGAMRVWLGIKSRGRRDGAGWLILGGAVSILLGVMVFLGLPATSIFVLGLFLGIDLLGTGIAMIALSFAERRATGDEAARPA